MAKEKYQKVSQQRDELREAFRQTLRTEFFSLFVGNVDCKQLSDDTLNFLLMKFYSNWDVALSSSVGSESAMEYVGES